MYRKIAAIGATAAAIVGVATAALAESGSSSTTPSTKTSTGSTAAHHRHHRQLRKLLEHAVHGSIVSKGATGYVTHDGIRGAVTTVSATSITVKDGDGDTETFTLGADTRVREHAAGKGHASKGSLADLKDGDQVAVLGKAAESATTDPVATIVLDGLRVKK